MNLCKYKDSLGKPNEGMHSYRLFNIAIMDLILTILAALIISCIFKFNFYYVLIIILLSGIFFHRLFCVKTTIDKLLFEK